MAERVLDALASDHALAPSIWWFEIRNVLIVNERRGRIDAAASARALALLRRLPITPDANPAEAALLDLARRHGLTVYDAAYLELARREQLALASLDKELRAAAGSEGIVLLR